MTPHEQCWLDTIYAVVDIFVEISFITIWSKLNCPTLKEDEIRGHILLQEVVWRVHLKL